MDRDNISIQTVIGVIFVIAALAIVPAVISVLTESVDNQVTTKSLVEEASYIIYKDGDCVCAKNGTTGRILTRNADTNTVIQAAIDATIQGSIYLTKSQSPGNWSELYPVYNWELYDYDLSNTTITVHDGVSIVGDDVVFLCREINTTLFSINPSGEHYFINGHNIEFNGLHFIGNESNTAFKLFSVNDYSRMLAFSSIYCRWVAYPYYVTGAVYNGLIDHCQIVDAITGVTLIKGAGNDYANAFRIENCDISGSNVGISTDGGYSKRYFANYFEANTVGVSIAGGTHTITNNYFKATAGQRCINVTARSDIILSNNDLLLNAGGIGFYNTFIGTKLTASSNNIYLAGSAAIGITASDTLSGSISSNIMNAAGSVTNGTSFITGKLQDLTVSSNYFGGGYPAVNITSTSVRLVISDNQFYYPKIGIQNAAVGIRITGNDLKAATVWNYYQTAGGGNLIANNMIEGTYKLLLAAGTANIYENNNGYLTEKYGTATILSGQTSIVVTHGLAATPSVVLVTGYNSAEVSACWITSPGTTTFTINVAAGVSANRVVYWYAEL